MLEVLSLTADAQQRSSTAVIFGFTHLLIVLGLNIFWWLSSDRASAWLTIGSGSCT
jgi:hypothetical protein